MRVPVKTKKPRYPVTPSNPTYEVDLTSQEMHEIKKALRDRLKVTVYAELRDTVSALAAIQWASEGRR